MNYDNLISGTELMIKSNKLRNEARELMISELGATDQSASAETFDNAAAERRIKCLKQQREQRLPSDEAVIFCGKTAPLPVPSTAP